MQILKAIDFIEARLSDELSLGSVAAAAGLSSYHFSRMFRALTGETLTSYIRRRRLTEAARRLIHRDDRLIELAQSYGFDSQAAFSRAFKRQFGVPPGAYRKARRAMPWAYRPALVADDFNLDEEFRAMEPKIVKKPMFKAVGMAKEFSQDSSDGIPALWTAFWKRHSEIKNAVEGHCLGLCVGVEDDDAFTYAAALEVSDIVDVPKDMCAWTIAGQTYAVFSVSLTGTEPIGVELRRANRYIWNTWLPKSGYVFAKAADFEYYDERFDPKTLSGEIDLYIPLRRAWGCARPGFDGAAVAL